MLALGTSDFVWFEVMASVSPIASADFGDPPHRLSTGDDHPLDNLGVRRPRFGVREPGLRGRKRGFSHESPTSLDEDKSQDDVILD